MSFSLFAKIVKNENKGLGILDLILAVVVFIGLVYLGRSFIMFVLGIYEMKESLEKIQKQLDDMV